MARIRYIALLSEDPAGLSSFYRTAFGMRELDASSSGNISLTDGAMNLTIFRLRPELSEPRMEQGLHHLGVEVDDIERAKARFRRLYPRGVMVPERGGAHYGELRFYDPECTPVSLSCKSFGVPPSEATLPRIGHVGFDALDPEVMRAFYAGVFGLTDIGPRDRLPHRVDDGHVALTFHDYFSPGRTRQPRYGVSHLGMLVKDDGKGMRWLSDPDGNRIAVVPSEGTAADLTRWASVA